MRRIPLVVFLIFSSAFFQGSFASPDDSGFIACNTELIKNRRAIADERWQHKPLDIQIGSAVKPYLFDGAQIVRWKSHRNQDGNSTIVVEYRLHDEDLDEWVVALKRGKDVEVKHVVSAVGFGFSKNSSEGMSGLFFCDKSGPSSEWIWSNSGSDWKVGGDK